MESVKEEGGRADPGAPRARTIGMCSLDGRNWVSPTALLNW
jgi:hypothetical protein